MFTQLKCYNVHSKKSVKMFTRGKGLKCSLTEKC